MRASWTDWEYSGDYRQDWLRQAARERLAREALGNPDRYLPADVAWVVRVVKSVFDWLASGLGNQTTPPPRPGYPLNKQQKHGV